MNCNHFFIRYLSFFAKIALVLLSQYAYSQQKETRILDSQKVFSDYSITPKFRLYPMTASIAASYAREKILWDERTDEEPLQFGMYRIGANAGAEGMVELAATIYPIPIMKLFIAGGGTYRYYQLPTFNCNQVNCSGFLQRLRFGFSFATAFGEAQSWVFIPTYEQINVGLGSSDQMIADESENILAAKSGDTFDAVTLVGGKKINNSLYGLYIRQGRFRNSAHYNEIQAAMVKTDWRETSFFFGLGRYASSFYAPGITFLLSYEWRWGKSQASF